MRTYLFLWLILVVCAACSTRSSHTTSSSPPLDSLFSQIERYTDTQAAFHLISRGQHPDTFPERSWTSYQAQLEQYQSFLSKLQAIPSATLSRQEQISREIMELKLQSQIDPIAHHQVLIPFNAEGGFFNRLGYHINSLPFKTEKDYQDYAEWLPAYATWLRQNMDLMKQGMQEGVMAPKVIVQNVLVSLNNFARTQVDKHPLGTPLSHFPSSFSQAQQDSITTQVGDALGQWVIPAYQNLLEFTRNEYLPAAPAAVGVSNIPHGKAFYETRVRYFTTLDLTPDSVFCHWRSRSGPYTRTDGGNH